MFRQVPRQQDDHFAATSQFRRVGCEVKILLADIHGFLNNLKAPIEQVRLRAGYCRSILTALLELLEPIQKDFESSSKCNEVEQRAYTPSGIKKREKKANSTGTRFLGTK